MNNMFSYFYISRIASHPKTSYQVEYKCRYSIIEMKQEATEEELLKHDLLFCGHGLRSDDFIQKRFKEYADNIKKYALWNIFKEHFNVWIKWWCKALVCLRLDHYINIHDYLMYLWIIRKDKKENWVWRKEE